MILVVVVVAAFLVKKNYCSTVSLPPGSSTQSLLPSAHGLHKHPWNLFTPDAIFRRLPSTALISPSTSMQ
jgi:hypothetical protein